MAKVTVEQLAVEYNVEVGTLKLHLLKLGGAKISYSTVNHPEYCKLTVSGLVDSGSNRTIEPFEISMSKIAFSNLGLSNIKNFPPKATKKQFFTATGEDTLEDNGKLRKRTLKEKP